LTGSAKYVEDPLSEALIQGRDREATTIEIFVDETGLKYRPVGIEEPGDALLIH